MAFRDTLNKETYAHFQKCNKSMLRDLDLSEKEICFLYDFDTKFELKIGSSLNYMAMIRFLGLKSHVENLFQILNKTFETGKGITIEEVFQYLIIDAQDKPEIDEKIETELYFEDHELLNELIRLRKNNGSIGRVNTNLNNAEKIRYLLSITP